MTDTLNKPQKVLIPNWDIDQIVDPKTGKATPAFRNIMLIVLNYLQTNFSNNGIGIPQQDTETINAGMANTGFLIYDKTTHDPKININGDWKVIQTV